MRHILRLLPNALGAVKAVNKEGCAVTAINDLIEDWIQIRSTLQRQIRLLEADKLQTGTRMLGDNTDEIVRHLKSWVSDLNKLLKEQSSASRA